jgi:hypothetical protein
MELRFRLNPDSCRPSSLEGTMHLRLTTLLAAGAMIILPATFAATAPAASSRNAVDDVLGQTRSFDDEPLGQPPAGATVTGSAEVQAAPFGNRRNRAVHLTDTSGTQQSRVMFPAPAAPGRRFEIDLSLHQVQQPVFVAIHGVGARPDLGAWRFMIAPVYGRDTAAQVSIYSGSAWQRLAVVPDLTSRDHVTHLRIDAAPDKMVLSTGDFVFRSTVRASISTAITGIELSSSGSASVGSDAFLDNLMMVDLDASNATFSEGIVASGTLASLTAGKAGEASDVATIDHDDVTSDDVKAVVHIGGRWVPGKTSGPPGHLTVAARLTEPDIGLQPVTVTITDRRTGLRRSTQMPIQSFAAISTSTVAQESPTAAEPRFPDALRLRDGRLIVVYHYAEAHTNANGVIRMVSSSDGGVTWTRPTTVLSNAYDNRDPKIAQLRDGTILLTVFRTDWTTQPASNIGTFVLRSRDGGRTFGEETKVDSAQPGAWEHAPAVELANGDVLQPLYGYGARVARSTDGGRTFPAANEQLVIPDDSAYSNSEPNITVLPSGDLVALVRTFDRALGAEVNSRIVRSFDNGYTWSSPEATDLPTSSHHQLLTEDGSVLLAFGNQQQAGRPTYAALIKHPSRPWTHQHIVPVYNSGWDDQANPSSVQLSDGSFLTFGFDIAAHAVVSWRSTSSTYQ